MRTLATTGVRQFWSTDFVAWSATRAARPVARNVLIFDRSGQSCVRVVSTLKEDHARILPSTKGSILTFAAHNAVDALFGVREDTMRPGIALALMGGIYASFPT
jgi:hypothetical protein